MAHAFAVSAEAVLVVVLVEGDEACGVVDVLRQECGEFKVVGQRPDRQWILGAHLFGATYPAFAGRLGPVVFGLVELTVEFLELFGGVAEVVLVTGHSGLLG